MSMHDQLVTLVVALVGLVALAVSWWPLWRFIKWATWLVVGFMIAWKVTRLSARLSEREEGGKG